MLRECLFIFATLTDHPSVAILETYNSLARPVRPSQIADFHALETPQQSAVAIDVYQSTNGLALTLQLGTTLLVTLLGNTNF